VCEPWAQRRPTPTPNRAGMAELVGASEAPSLLFACRTAGGQSVVPHLEVYLPSPTVEPRAHRVLYSHNACVTISLSFLVTMWPLTKSGVSGLVSL
jgi:hypothetical protein